MNLTIAILGARGIPACYSGYDTLVEQLSLGLVRSNTANVVVYCRSSYYQTRPPAYRGVELVYLPAPRIKGLESLLHSLLSTLHILCRAPDVVYFVDPANAPFCLLLKAFGNRVIIHTDGLGWKRRKWSRISRMYYKAVERLASHSAHALITDNPEMQRYYKAEYGSDSYYISYGAENDYGNNDTIYSELDLLPKQYLLVVARLERENNTDLIIREYVRSQIGIPLIIVGDSPYSRRYTEELHSIANHKVTFAGRVNDQARLNSLYRGAYLYIHGHEVGGTNPSLLRAMHSGATPVVLSVPFNVSVIGDAGFSFTKQPLDLATLLSRLVSEQSLVLEAGTCARRRANREFTWSKVVEEHVQMFRDVINPFRG